MHSHGLVAEKRFRARRCYDNPFGAISAGISDFPKVAVGFLAFNFQIRNGALQLRIPIDKPIAAVDEPLLIKRDEAFDNDLGELVIHRKVKAIPVDAVAHAAHLLENCAARVLLPLPDLFVKGFAADVSAVNALGFELAFNHDLRRDACMVRAGEPHRVVARHAVVARERIHHRLIEGVAHVQDARDVGRRQLDGKARFLGIEPGAEIAALFPGWVPAGFDLSRFKAFGKFGLVVRHLEVSKVERRKSAATETSSRSPLARFLRKKK